MFKKKNADIANKMAVESGRYISEMWETKAM